MFQKRNVFYGMTPSHVLVDNQVNIVAQNSVLQIGIGADCFRKAALENVIIERMGNIT